MSSCRHGGHSHAARSLPLLRAAMAVKPLNRIPGDTWAAGWEGTQTVVISSHAEDLLSCIRCASPARLKAAYVPHLWRRCVAPLGHRGEMEPHRSAGGLFTATERREEERREESGEDREERGRRRREKRGSGREERGGEKRGERRGQRGEREEGG